MGEGSAPSNSLFDRVFRSSSAAALSPAETALQNAACSAAVGAGFCSTSPSLHTRYAEASELPSTMPDAGYIGKVYVVTTDPGVDPTGASLELSFDGEELSAIGGTQYLAIYRFDTGTGQWVTIRGEVNSETKTVQATIDSVGLYAISADLPQDTTPPTVRIDSPPSGSIINQDTTLVAIVDDDLGARRVQFYLNDHLVGEDSSPEDGWTCPVTVADYCEGDWTLRAVAEDFAGNKGEATIPVHIHSSTPPPTVAIAFPAPGNMLSGTVTLSGTCGDEVAVASVELAVDGHTLGFADVNAGNWTCDVDTTSLLDGSRVISATVEDMSGNAATAQVNATINNGNTGSSVGAVRLLPVGSSGWLSSGVVVAGPDLIGNGFYVESVDRSSGLRITTDRTANVGDVVSIFGSLALSGNEKVLQAYDVITRSSGSPLPGILGLDANRLLGYGLDSVGKLVKTWGQVTGVDSAFPAKWFTILNGNGTPTTCIVPTTIAPPTSGYVTVQGICSVAPTGQSIIYVRSQGDIGAQP